MLVSNILSALAILASATASTLHRPLTPDLPSNTTLLTGPFYEYCGADISPRPPYIYIKSWWFRNWATISTFTPEKRGHEVCAVEAKVDRDHHLYKGRCSNIIPKNFLKPPFTNANWKKPRKEGYMRDCCMVFYWNEHCDGDPVAGWHVEQGARFKGDDGDNCHDVGEAKSVLLFCPKDKTLVGRR